MRWYYTQVSSICIFHLCLNLTLKTRTPLTFPLFFTLRLQNIHSTYKLIYQIDDMIRMFYRPALTDWQEVKEGFYLFIKNYSSSKFVFALHFNLEWRVVLFSDTRGQSGCLGYLLTLESEGLWLTVFCWMQFVFVLISLLPWASTLLLLLCLNACFDAGLGLSRGRGGTVPLPRP